VATLGLLVVLQSIGTLRYKATTKFVKPAFPTSQVHIRDVVIPADRLWLFAIATLLTIVLVGLARCTRFGLQTTAVAETPRVAASVGVSPHLVAGVNWALGAALAGAAGTLIAPLTGLNVSSLSLLIVGGLAAALIASFRSFSLVLVGGLLVGIAQSEVTRYVTTPGAVEAVPFAVIIVFLVVTGRALPLRDHFLEHRPRLGEGRFRPVPTAGALVVYSALAVTVLPTRWTDALTVSAIGALFLLSLVVLTGYAGQLSLAQYALGGVGALAAARLVASRGWPFELAIVAGVATAVATGLVFALPALRTRGVNLAVVTLGLGVALRSLVFTNPDYTGGAVGTAIGPQTVLGIDVDPIAHSGRYSVLAFFFVALCAWVICNVRTSTAGRRLVAVRTNERAAAALGVSTFTAKLFAFGLSAGVAGLAGILLVFQSHTAVFDQFEPFASINAVALAVVGGVGYVTGPLLGSTLVAGGVGSLPTSAIFGTTQWLVLVGGVALLLLLLQNPNGMADQTAMQLRGLRERLPRRASARPADEIPPAPALVRRAPAQLAATGVTVRFGGVVALEGVSVRVATGEIVGLVGPNGAGKSTLVDAITGFVRSAQGTITLDGERLDRLPPHRRTRLGLARSFQSLELFDDMTVRENLLAASDDHRTLAYASGLLLGRRGQLSDDAISALHDLGLVADLDRLVSELPHGRQRLVAIARALATHPSIVLLDEPAAGLDVTETAELGRLIRALSTDRGLGVVLIEHDLSIVTGICDRVVVLDFGTIIAEGTPAEVWASAAVQRAYLGVEDAPSARPTSELGKASAGHVPGAGA
jgi:sulfate-transporting ATPase